MSVYRIVLTCLGIACLNSLPVFAQPVTITMVRDTSLCAEPRVGSPAVATISRYETGEILATQAAGCRSTRAGAAGGR